MLIVMVVEDANFALPACQKASSAVDLSVLVGTAMSVMHPASTSQPRESTRSSEGYTLAFGEQVIVSLRFVVIDIPVRFATVDDKLRAGLCRSDCPKSAEFGWEEGSYRTIAHLVRGKNLSWYAWLLVHQLLDVCEVAQWPYGGFVQAV
ncbi:hypothetical protein AbraIFM66951_011429 [Aspergillus brasiliensis]|uniref:Uncharacterized protein n=1 Tax=Aspergillus brasiliensis TaxID=319629 RepID=A0A9W5YNQ2_9EURO|nr:hypothetical protein AbraCBS73388_003617 [Aspergillus brasiliensis]GKZ47856.1 hypothetical protein AbraIFM66951_011429 [Aspergillus brasiliensis]